MSEQPDEVETAEIREQGDPGERAEGERVREEDERQRRVGDAHDDVGRRKRRVRAGGDGPVSEVDAEHVAAAHRDDSVDPDSGDVRAEHRRPGDPLVRVCGGDHVPPGAAGARELEQVAADRQE